jgi:hypothetical protein
MFLVIGSVLFADCPHGATYLGIAQFAARRAISPNAPVLEEKGSVEDLYVVLLVGLGYCSQVGHSVILPPPEKAATTCVWEHAVSIRPPPNGCGRELVTSHTCQEEAVHGDAGV